MAGLDKLLRTLTEKLIALVHLDQARLMLFQLCIQLVHRLRSTRSYSKEGRRVVYRTNMYLLLLFLNLRLEEAHPAGHLVDPTDLAHERALERIDIRVQLV